MTNTSRPPASELRPWSEHTAEQQIEAVLDALAEAVLYLDHYAAQAADAEHEWRKAEARATVALPGKMKGNAETRRAAVYLACERDDGTHPRRDRDYAENGLRNQRSRVAQLQTEASIAQSKLVGARRAGDTAGW